jgi:hypothetical protein
MDELHRLGCWVTSANPLHGKALRFEVANDRIPAVLEKLSMRDWHPKPVGAGKRIIPEGNSALVKPVSIYEYQLEADEPPKPGVQTTTVPGGEIVARPITSRQIRSDDSEDYKKLLEGFRGKK